jgi:hypothetical protein
MGGSRSAAEVGPVASTRRRIRTGPLPRLPEHALDGARTLEARALPMLFMAAFVALVIVQLVLRL